MKYSNEFKNEIITRYRSGETITKISTESGVPKSTLYLWIKPYSKIKSRMEPVPTIHQYNTLKQRIKKLEAMIEVLQRVECCAQSPLKERLNNIELLHGQYSVHVLCEALNVSRGTYYNHILRNKREDSFYTKHRNELKQGIQAIFDESGQIFGAAKIAVMLREKGYQASPSTIRSVMYEMG